MHVLLTKFRLPLIIAAVALLLMAAVFLIGRMSKPSIKVRKRKLPTGGMGIPSNGSGGVWSPDVDVINIRAAMFGAGNGSWWDMRSYGTNEQAIFKALEGKSDDQLTAIYNEYASRYKGSELLTDFRDELSGDDLTRALSFFQFI